jgi:hypothetical protein
MQAPEPTAVTHAKQYWTEEGEEIFMCEAYGRRPDVRDSLRVFATGENRGEAQANARNTWRQAWWSLHTKSVL